jgi:hypothetical protein
VEFSVGFDIPLIGEGGVKTTLSGEFKNTRSDRYAVTLLLMSAAPVLTSICNL